jgi:hypothetical protein
MGVTRINEFRARQGHAAPLRDFLRGVVPTIEAAPGCRSCRLLEGHGDPTLFVVIEEWDDIEAHRAASGRIPPDQLQQVMAMLVEPPGGDYFEDALEARSAVE